MVEIGANFYVNDMFPKENLTCDVRHSLRAGLYAGLKPMFHFVISVASYAATAVAL